MGDSTSRFSPSTTARQPPSIPRQFRDSLHKMATHESPKLGHPLDAITNFSVLPDAEAAECLAQIAHVASHASIEIFLVGGTVRDMVLRRNALSGSLDLTVVGEAADFARMLAAKIENCELVSTSQHHTAEVDIGGTKVDIASARTDTYDPPGSLPQITLVDDITADLIRRDYTVNAMALPISTAGFGRLIDPFDGSTDAKNRSLRVLRQESFIEDPLRMLRGIRLAARYQFDFEPRIASLMSASLDQLELMCIRSPERVFNEFRLWFHPNENLGDLVKRARDAGLLAPLGITCVNEIDTLRKLRVDSSELERFAAFTYRLDAEIALILADRLQMPSAWRTTVRQVSRCRQVADRCATGEVTDLSLRNSLMCVRDEVLRAVIAIETDANFVGRFTDFRDRIRHLRPELNGDDLINLGIPRGPQVGEILNELLEMRIERTISNANEEREHVIRRLSDG